MRTRWSHLAHELFDPGHRLSLDISKSAGMLEALRIIVSINGRDIDLDALSTDDFADTLLEEKEVIGCHSIGLCNNGDKVDTGSKTLHNLDIERLQTIRKVRSGLSFLRELNLRVSSGPDKEEASVDSQISLLATLICTGEDDVA